MAEKVIEKENIFRTARKLGEPESAKFSAMSSHKKLIEYSFEFSGVGKEDRMMIVDLGGGQGGLGRIVEDLRKQGRDITCVNVDYSIKELLKGGGDRVLGDMMQLPLRNNSADAVFVISYYLDAENLMKHINEYKIGWKDVDERNHLLQNLADIADWQERLFMLEAARVLKKGGKLITAGDFDPSILMNQVSGRELTKVFELRRKEVVKIEDEVKGIAVYEKMKDEGLEGRIAEAREQLKSLVELLEIYEAKGGLLWRMRKEGRI